ncbi:MAG: hypothetical protein WCG19_03520 [Chlorobiaceae bacterium]
MSRVTHVLKYKGSYAGLHRWVELIQNPISIGLVVCLIIRVLGESPFASVTMPGSKFRDYMGYIDAAFNYFAIYLTAPLLLISIILEYKDRRVDFEFDIKVVLTLIIFVIYALIHVFISESIVRDNRSEMMFSSITVGLIAYQLRKRNDINTFWNTMIIVGVVFVLMSLISGQLFSIMAGNGLVTNENNISKRIRLGKDTITSASLLYQCALACAAYVMINYRITFKLICIIATIICLVIMGILTGSKGPLLSFIVAIFVQLISNRFSFFKILFIFILIISLYYTIPYLLIYKGAFDHLMIGGQDEFRQEMYNYIIHSSPSIVGNGVGSFANHFGMTAIEGGYPHNSFLEVYYEMGIFGLILLVLLLYRYGVNLLINSKSNYTQKYILSYFSYAVVLSLFSGSIFSDSVMWMVFAFTDNIFTNNNQL